MLNVSADITPIRQAIEDRHEIAKMELINDAIDRLGYPKKNIEWMVNELWPKLDVHQGKTGEMFDFHITSSPLATLAGAAMAADTNTAMHTGDSANTQSTVLIAKCGAAALAGVVTVLVQAELGIPPNSEFVLYKITPDVSFKQAVPVGKTVCISLQWCKTNRRVLVFKITGTMLESGVNVFEERTITLPLAP